MLQILYAKGLQAFLINATCVNEPFENAKSLYCKGF
jgi:hypothetical protein